VAVLTKRKVLICSAWPYASNIQHLGNLIGSLLSGDAFTRFYRLKGDDVLHVSGSDAHGTHIEIEALKQGTTPAELCERMHHRIAKTLVDFEIDMFYTSTTTPTHHKFVTEIYSAAEANGFILAKEEEQAYCTNDEKFLADRFIQGTCPNCSSPHAYGNQCDDCGSLIEAKELIDPICRICGQSSIEFRATKNWYLDLPKLAPQLKEFVESRAFAGNVKKFTQNLIDDIEPRAVTRDIKWGIPAPFEGADDKVIYVWAEAALGYASATLEYFEQQGNPEGFKDYWLTDVNVKHVYTQGKDNIPFHTVFFPAQLLSSGVDYHLPDQVAATEYLNWIGGAQFSKTRGVGLTGEEALELLESTYWRFYLFSYRPEQRDIDFSWENLDLAINGVLANNIANLIHRVASLAAGRYDGIVQVHEIDAGVKAAVEKAKNEYERFFEEGFLAPALRQVTDLAVVGNEYVQREKPWEETKPHVITSAYYLVKALAILLEPFVPTFSQKVYKVLSITEPTLDDVVYINENEIALEKPERLLEKIDVEELQERHAQISGDNNP
jgi:methionyl-tRNA synthetase